MKSAPSLASRQAQRGKSTLIGNPPPAVAVELEKLWKKQFRSQSK
jgi:hypothetical protein